MDDARIRQLTAEVLKEVQGAPAGEAGTDLEARVAALEAAVARLQSTTAGSGSPATRAPEVPVHAHPALRVLDVSGGSDRCVLEPDRPCVQSHACRTLGH
jgi:hypothetical protein